MAFSPVFIKPARLTRKSPDLKKSKVLKNAMNSVETAVIIDLNILSKMNQVVKGEITLNESGLKDLVKTLNNVRGLCLSPGFALNEAEASYVRELYNSYETFLERYCRDYIDHPGAIKTKIEKENVVQFEELSVGDRYVNAITYLTIVKTQLISRSRQKVSPEEQFYNLLSFLAEKADIIGAVEVEAAKYVFFNTDEVKDVKFRAYCKKIKDNFKKGGNSSEKLLARSLNAARDIVYYRIAAGQQNTYIDGKMQDCWLLTADDGLANLTNSIYFVPQENGEDSKYVTFQRNKEQEKSEYWQYCDHLLEKTIQERRRESSAFTESDFEKLFEVINELELGIKELFTEPAV
ncbi:hypothetical protein LZP73_07910 [Shewanella sp. AS16]|uniref:hypothetical protein n=1 Tax=Shewanella sp. AS16 TaxID=2907625 RepID=UPI001F394C57|nr:hypothetical protein [Shewanella sp. AS16]MCE9686141.1 hypothetical protein [Shewanella sp. AS16]